MGLGEIRIFKVKRKYLVVVRKFQYCDILKLHGGSMPAKTDVSASPLSPLVFGLGFIDFIQIRI